MSLIARLAANAPPPVFACVGPGMQMAVERLLAGSGVRRAISPRSAAILLVAGDIPDRAAAAFDRVHDQVPAPRRTVHWDGRSDPVPDLLTAWRDLLKTGAGEPDRLPDTPPNPWHGEGDHGQGGEGMMGGTPYGRPMAMTGGDPRDGLEMDRFKMHVGPFAPMLPTGLELELELKGDVIAHAKILHPPFEVNSAEEASRVGTARILRLLGLEIQADRLLRTGPASAALALRAIPKGLGAISGGTDARGRLRDCLEGQAAKESVSESGPALEGLEWHEAMLVLNSWPPSALRPHAEAA